MALHDDNCDGMTREEAQLRLWAFHQYYNRCFATELNNTLRFCKAIVASAGPIPPEAAATFREDLKRAMAEKLRLQRSTPTAPEGQELDNECDE